MTKGTVFWLDEEESAAYPEIMQLRFHSYDVDYMKNVNDALNRIIGSDFDPSVFGAFIIDAHMPTFGDIRFEQSSLLDRNLAGVRLCDILIADYPILWASIRDRTLIYTMLSRSSRVHDVKKFADNNGVKFFHKSDDDQIYDHLISLGWLS